MRAVMVLAAGAAAVVLAGAPAPGQPAKADRPPERVPADTSEGAVLKWVADVHAALGADAEVVLRLGSGKQEDRVTDALLARVQDAFRECRPEGKVLMDGTVPKLSDKELWAVEVATRGTPAKVYRLAATADLVPRPGGGPALPALYYTSPDLGKVFVVSKPAAVADTLAGSFAVVPGTGAVLQPPPDEAGGKAATEVVELPGFGTVALLMQKPGAGGKLVRAKVSPTAVTFPIASKAGGDLKVLRYRCPDLDAGTTFEIALTNDQENAWALDVALDGRSSTKDAGEYAGARWILPGKAKADDRPELTVPGWLKAPQEKAGPDGELKFDVAKFRVETLFPKDPALNKTAAEHRSTIRIAWHGAWKGNVRPKWLGNPQGGGTEVVGEGAHATVNAKVERYNMDQNPLKTVVIEFGGKARSD